MVGEDCKTAAFAGPIPWDRIFQHLSLAFGWTPAEISELTLAQVWSYLGNTRATGPTAYLRPTEARQLSQRLKQLKKT